MVWWFYLPLHLLALITLWMNIDNDKLQLSETFIGIINRVFPKYKAETFMSTPPCSVHISVLDSELPHITPSVNFPLILSESDLTPPTFIARLYFRNIMSIGESNKLEMPSSQLFA
jgi:hypothetical protein